MTWQLLLAGLVVLAAATALVIRAILRGRSDLRELRELEQADRLSLLAYHARRSQQIRAQIDAMGDEAEHLFPPARNGS